MVRKPASAAIGRVRRVLGRLWLRLADAGELRKPLNRASVNEYPRYPWF